MAAARPERLGCYILAGSDFPDSVEQAIMSWGIAVTIIKDPSRLSTRGLLKYLGESFKGQLEASRYCTPGKLTLAALERTFEYTTPPLQPTPGDLSGSTLLQSNAFHFLASPELMATFATDLAVLRVSAGVTSQPLIVWEPAPYSCIQASQSVHLQTAKFVDIYSPNHLEFLQTFGSRDGDELPAEFDRAKIEELVLRVLESGVGRDGEGAAVIRCGEHGCMVAARSYSIRWFPAFHSEASRVSDATGAGNAFLGGFVVTLGTTSDLTEAAIAGSVAASFVIEQVGLPRRTTSRQGTDMWNGEAFSARADRFRTILETPANG